MIIVPHSVVRNLKAIYLSCLAQSLWPHSHSWQQRPSGSLNLHPWETVIRCPTYPWGGVREGHIGSLDFHPHGPVTSPPPHLPPCCQWRPHWEPGLPLHPAVTGGLFSLLSGGTSGGLMESPNFQDCQAITKPPLLQSQWRPHGKLDLQSALAVMKSSPLRC